MAQHHWYYWTTTYKSRSEMIYRCNRKWRKYYNELWIKVCDRWLDFRNFIYDMWERPEWYSIDRMNVLWDYNKDNCRRATNKQQWRNRRNNRLVKWKTLSEWSEVLWIKRSTLAQRLYVYKRPIDRVLSTI